MTFVVLFIFPIVVGELAWGGWCFLTDRLGKARAEREGLAWSSAKHAVPYVILGIVLPCFYCFLVVCLAGTAADSQYRSRNSNARQLYGYVMTYCSDMDIDSPGTVIGYSTDPAEEGSLEAYLQQYFWEESDPCGFAVICNAEGEIQYTLYARKRRLTEADLHLPEAYDKDQEIRNYLFDRPVTGCFVPGEKTN